MVFYGVEDCKKHESLCPWEWYDYLIIITNLSAIAFVALYILRPDIAFLISALIMGQFYGLLCAIKGCNPQQRCISPSRIRAYAEKISSSVRLEFRSDTGAVGTLPNKVEILTPKNTVNETSNFYPRCWEIDLDIKARLEGDSAQFLKRKFLSFT